MFLRPPGLFAIGVLTVSAGAIAPSPARATPGPDSVAVLANADVPGSVALAARYASARDIPSRQVCSISMPVTEDVTLDVFRARVEAPLRACLEAAGVRPRIEAIVVMRGAPLRVVVDVAGVARTVSLTSALALGDTVLSADGAPLLGRDPGQDLDCGGTACWGAAWPSAFHAEPFHAGWTRTERGIVHRPLLVTMLHGRSDDDAARLLTAALDSEGRPPSEEILFMDGADPARGALDGETEAVLSGLAVRGRAARRVPFAADQSGLRLAGFFTGTASLGATIEGNSFAPGALVDNLTSFGALPENFRETGEAQVSIARWVARGVTGVHGTVAEPLNNCFPSRRLVLEYADGATLAEAYYGRMPFVYWQNLVLGDPVAAPYAVRPQVVIDGVADGSAVPSGRTLAVHAESPAGRPIERLALYRDGVLLAEAEGGALEACLVGSAPGPSQLLAVATSAGDLEHWPARGWTRLNVEVAPGPDGCTAPAADAGTIDAGVDPDGAVVGLDAGGTPGPTSAGGCRIGPSTRTGTAVARVLWTLALALVSWRRRPRLR